MSKKKYEKTIKNAKKKMLSFSAISDIAVNVIFSDEEIPCHFCRKPAKKCQNIIQNAITATNNFNGRHIFFCRLNYVYFVAPLKLNNSPIAYFLAGPIRPATFDGNFEEIYMQPAPLPNVPTIPCELILHYADIFKILAEKCSPFSQEYSSENNFFEKNIKLIYDLIEENDIQKMSSMLADISFHLMHHIHASFEVRKGLCFELALQLCNILSNLNLAPQLIFGTDAELCELIKSASYDNQLENFLNKVFSNFSSAIFGKKPVRHNQLIRDAIKYIEQNYHKKLTLEDVSSEVFLSPTYFSKLFRDEVGITYSEYLNFIRINVAKQLIINSSLSLLEIATLVGFEAQSYFCKVFKKQTGVSPKRFKSVYNADIT